MAADVSGVAARLRPVHTSAVPFEASRSTKSADSEADVDPDLLDILKTWRPRPGEGSPFVIESATEPRPQSVRNHHYRCNHAFKELVKWLRGKGLPMLST